MKFRQTIFPGLCSVDLDLHRDRRGSFVKTFHETFFGEANLSFTMKEEFFSRSQKGVLRGMHYQVAPAAHSKLIYCIVGHVLDVVLDLRADSPTFQRSYTKELNEQTPCALYIPRGFAHGFLTLSSEAIMIYKTDFVYSPEYDAGLRWDSFGFDWGISEAILSDRDRAFPPLSSISPTF